MKEIGVAVLGLGTVGQGTCKILQERTKIIADEYGVNVVLKKVLVRDIRRNLDRGVDESMLTVSIDDILKDESIQIVAECIGGTTSAKEYIIKAIENKKTIVTANKELFSKKWLELESLAKKNKVGLYYEASCGGGIPIIRTMTEALQANDVNVIKAIINGTTNYILTRMTKEGLEYAEILKDAQRLGYAEQDPTADVDGYDASYKLAILSTLAFNRYLSPELIYREGIQNISQDDIKYGKKFGYIIKLLAIAKRVGNKIEARVHPVFIKDKHPLASVSDAFNAILLTGDNVGDLMLYGRGAGERPTGSAVVSDIVFAARNLGKHARYDGIENAFTVDSIMQDFYSKYYLNILVDDEPGVISQITGIFAKNNISIKSMYQEKADEDKFVPVILFTHEINERNIIKALEEIKELKEVVKINNMIRVES